MQTAETVLSIIQKRGVKKMPIERLYRQLYNHEFYLRAYAKLYRNKGALTHGVTNQTVDGMSLQRISRLVDLLRTEQFRWTPVRRTYIPKKDGSKRPLGIPSWEDKMLQEVIRMLLEAYYEPRFSDHSHGFRPKRGCHTALEELRNTCRGTVWIIEGDISKCFDRFDHDVLIGILRRDIKDERFIKLMESLLRAGYLEDWKWNKTLSGTPQGGVISPLLANIYLHELDTFVEEELKPQYTKGERRRYNPTYSYCANKKQIAKKRNDRIAYKAYDQRLRSIPSCDTHDPDYRRLRYVRYADDFLLAFAGPKSEAEAIKDQLATFLGKELHRTTDFLFLGRGVHFPIALEGALKLKEISYIHAEGYPAAEMKHGPIALINENCPSVFFVPKGEIFNKIVSSMQEIKARKGKIIAIVTAGCELPAGLADEVIEIPDCHEAVLPIVATIPVQLLSYYIAVERHCDVDKPRNLAKSVTVE